jgi:hypothetical protein
MKAFLQDRDGINEKLKNGLYAEPALVPESSWLGKETPARPDASAESTQDGVKLKTRVPRGKEPWQWLVCIRTADGWKTRVLPGGDSEHTIKLQDGDKPTSVIVSGVSRLGREGRPARVEIDHRK